MSSSDLLSSTLSWPSKGIFGTKSSVLQTTESDLVKQSIVSDHMRYHYRRLHGARSAIDSKPPKSMILGQKSRDRARREAAQSAYAQSILNEYSTTSKQNTPRRPSSQSARRTVQSQPTTFRARSGSIERRQALTRSLTMGGSTRNLTQTMSNDNDIANKLFGDGALTQALTAMAALGKITSTARNKNSADILDKHPDAFVQPNPEDYQPRLLKREGSSSLANRRSCYNPPRRRTIKLTEADQKPDPAIEEKKKEEEEQLALSMQRVREQLNRSLELRQNVEKKIKKANATPKSKQMIGKQSDEILKRYSLTEQERLEYVRFMQEVTDAIIRSNFTTESAIAKLFEMYIDKHKERLDEQRLRSLLEALKDDLGVMTSQKNNSYTTVRKATNYDKEPLPPRVSKKTNENSLVLTPHTPYDSRRRSSFDVNELLPWQQATETTNQRMTTDDMPIEPLTHVIDNSPKIDLSNDDYLLTTAPNVIKPKPRLSTIKRSDDDIAPMNMAEPESSLPTNFNATIRKPMNDNLHDMSWLKDAPVVTKRKERSSLGDVVEDNLEHNDHEIDEYRNQQSPIGEEDNHSEANTYGSNDFEDDNEQHDSAA